jgi:hypothetical protein
MALARAQAAGAEAGAPLRQAYVYELLCADQAGEAGAAQTAAARLRRLRAPDPPDGVSDQVWARYPAIDATGGVAQAPLLVTSTPDGAVVWIDHAPAGRTPLTAYVDEGVHLVAAAAGGATRAASVDVKGAAGAQAAHVAFTLVQPPQARWADVAARVRAWRSGASHVTAAALGKLLLRAGVRFAVVIGDRGQLEVWERSKKGTTAVDLGAAHGVLEIGALVDEAEKRGAGPGIDPDQPLLVENPAGPGGKKKESGPSRQEWWVYASVVGAIVIAAGAVAANDLADDHQKIQIRF